MKPMTFRLLIFLVVTWTHTKAKKEKEKPKTPFGKLSYSKQKLLKKRKWIFFFIKKFTDSQSVLVVLLALSHPTFLFFALHPGILTYTDQATKISCFLASDWDQLMWGSGRRPESKRRERSDYSTSSFPNRPRFVSTCIPFFEATTLIRKHLSNSCSS